MTVHFFFASVICILQFLWKLFFDDNRDDNRNSIDFGKKLFLKTFICKWDYYHVFLIVALVFTRLLLDEIYHLIELPFEWLIDDAMFVCLLDELILGFCYSDLTLETGGFELASTITLVLQVNWLNKCASHPK